MTRIDWSALLATARGRALLLVLAVALGALLRLWNAPYVAGFRFEPDSPREIERAEAVSRGDFRPLLWSKPQFMPYTAGIVFKTASALGVEAPRRLLFTFYLIALSLATIPFAYLLGTWAFSDARKGLLSACLQAVVPLDVAASRIIKEDTPLMFCATVAVALLIRLVLRPDWKSYVLSGFAAGVAFAAKGPGGVVFVAALAAHGLAWWDGERSLRRLLGREIWFFGAAALAGFLLFNPYLLVEPRRYFEGFAYEVNYYRGGHHDGTAFHPWSDFWTFYLRKALWPGLTTPVLAAAIVGLARIRWKTHRAAAVLAVWTVAYYLFMEGTPSKPYPAFGRYMLPIVPALCAFAAAFLVDAVAAPPRPAFKGAALALLLGALAVPAAKSAVIVHGQKPDTRLVAAEWIRENIPAGSALFMQAPYYSPPVSESRYRVEWRNLFDPNVHAAVANGTSRFDYAVITSFMVDRFADNRDTNPHAARLYGQVRDLLDRCPALTRIRPLFPVQTYLFHNPVITILDLSACGE